MTTRRRARLIRRLAERDGWLCAYCRVQLGIGVDDVQPTFDHVRPRSRGGHSELANLVLACQPCNTAKGNKIWHEPPRPGIPMDSTCRHLSAAAVCLNCAGP